MAAVASDCNDSTLGSAATASVRAVGRGRSSLSVALPSDDAPIVAPLSTGAGTRGTDDDIVLAATAAAICATDPAAMSSGCLIKAQSANEIANNANAQLILVAVAKELYQQV